MASKQLGLKSQSTLMSERIGDAYVLLNEINAQLAKMTALRGTEKWSNKLEQDTQYLSALRGIFIEFIDISIQTHGMKKPVIQ